MCSDVIPRPPVRSFADRVRAGDESLFGTWVKLPAVEVVELLRLAGFDYIIIDLEHSAMTLRDASTLIAVASNVDLPALVRVPDHTASVLARVLDCGAAGVVVPQVNSARDARAVVDGCRFPPVGHRGAGVTTRAGRWGMEGLDSYLESGSSALIVVQMESESAIAAAGEIASVDGVDAVLFGPQDLALSAGADAPTTAGLIRGAEERLTSSGIPVGIAVGFDASSARDYAQRGYRLVVTSNDASILGLGARSFVQQLRPAGAEVDHSR